MSNDGKDIERLIALLERSLSPKGVQIEVNSPDRIAGKTSGSLREVDVSLRSQVGSTEILIVLECRDHNTPQDVTWIEQLVGKRREIGADKIVAVSSSGFTSGATNYAVNNGIELRTIEEVNPEEISLWFDMTEIPFHERHYEFSRVDFSKEVFSNFTPPLRNDTPIFKRKIDGSPASLINTQNCIPPDRLFENICLDGSRKPVTIRLQFSLDDCFQLETKEGPIDITDVTFSGTAWVEVKKIPLTSVRQYKTGEIVLAKTAAFDFEISGQQHTIELHDFGEGKGQIVSIRAKTEPLRYSNKIEKVKLSVPETAKSALLTAKVIPDPPGSIPKATIFRTLDDSNPITLKQGEQDIQVDLVVPRTIFLQTEPGTGVQIFTRGWIDTRGT